jgi:carboxynorspermidine decarboxylase
MIHYTIVKTSMFNGISHPPVALWTEKGDLTVLKEFAYEDYRNRMA